MKSCFEKINSLQVLPLLLVVGILFITSCKEEHKEFISVTIDKETVPTMVTRDVETLISDSGIMRYRIIAPLWYVFEESKEPKWIFPEGLILQKYDDFNNIDATVECDSATYLSKRRLWQLDGYVSMMNIDKDKFLTEQLFWNQETRRVYSDSFIHIERQDRIIEGYGFESNDRLTEYTVHNPTGIFPTSDIKRGIENDSIKNKPDTVSVDTVVEKRKPTTIKRKEPGQLKTIKTLDKKEQVQFKKVN